MGLNSTFFLRDGNEAIKINPPHGLDFHITKRGSDWLWTVFSIFGFLAVIYMFMYFLAELKNAKRLTKYALGSTLLITIFQFFGYFLYASNLGWTPIQAEFNHLHVHPSITGKTPGVRQIFYEKYVVWVLCWPVLLFLSELTGISLAEASSLETEEFSAIETIHSLLIEIVGTEYWVVSLLIGALIKSSYKWGPWVFGCVVMLFVQCVQVRRQFFVQKIRGFTQWILILSMLIVWCYFIAWGVSEGGNKIQPDGEAVFYGILDICIFAILPGYLLFVNQHYGELPDFSVKLPHFRHNKDEEEAPMEEPKASEPNSIRASGETAIPDTASATASNQ